MKFAPECEQQNQEKLKGPLRGSEKRPLSLTLIILFFASLLAATLARHSFLHALLLARLQVKGVTLHVLDYVFLLNLAFKPTESVLYRLALLNPNFRQTGTPPNQPGSGSF